MRMSAPTPRERAVRKFPVSRVRLSTRLCVVVAGGTGADTGGLLEPSRTSSLVSLAGEGIEAMEDILEVTVGLGLGTVVGTADPFQNSNAPPRMRINVPLRISRAADQCLKTTAEVFQDKVAAQFQRGNADQFLSNGVRPHQGNNVEQSLDSPVAMFLSKNVRQCPVSPARVSPENSAMW